MKAKLLYTPRAWTTASHATGPSCSPLDGGLSFTDLGRGNVLGLSSVGEGKGNPLQCSCLGNPRDGRAWWAAIYGVAQSRTWLKRFTAAAAVLEKTLESPLDCKEFQPVHPKGDQSWVFIGGTDVEVETPILWPPHAKGWLIGKDPDAGRYWGQEEKGTTEDEMAGWHHRLDGHEFQ